VLVNSIAPSCGTWPEDGGGGNAKVRPKKRGERRRECCLFHLSSPLERAGKGSRGEGGEKGGCCHLLPTSPSCGGGRKKRKGSGISSRGGGKGGGERGILPSSRLFFRPLGGKFEKRDGARAREAVYVRRSGGRGGVQRCAGRRKEKRKSAGKEKKV